ncbi:hypothetical protein L2E82_42770 [Cichorium intybus]|uniref:Uncharacterized protein n=1 Tax=Cichorium intybus TaxID=13427 RepID=A0ACB8ZMV7_CICIN|nr:hypothetical protein L2E82_42770 [Cichorium intybus]
MVQNQFNTTIKTLKSDNAKEYFQAELGNYLSQQGIVHITSCVDTPQQNSVAERKNRHLLEVTRSLLFSSLAPNHLWGEAVLTAAYLINRMPSRVIGFRTPHHVFRSLFPHSRNSSDLPLKVFGCTSFVHNHSPNCSKLDPRYVKCIFVGYSPSQQGYKCYSPINKKFYHSNDVTLFENELFYSKTNIQGENDTMEYQFLNQEPIIMPIIDTEAQIEDPSLTNQSDHLKSTTNNDYIVYTRRPRQPVVEQVTTTASNHESTPDNQGNSETYTSTTHSDLDILIALRKGKRSCTAHPIRNFISYEKLSPRYKAFALSLSEIQVPKTFQEATEKKEWADAV